MNNILPYEEEAKVNNERMASIFKQLFPNLDLSYEYVYELLLFLNTTKVNVEVLPRVIRGVNNIIIGTGKGQVIVHVIKETMNVSVRETDDELKTRG